MAETESEKTPLQQKLDEFSEQLSKVSHFQFWKKNFQPQYARVFFSVKWFLDLIVTEIN